MATRSAKAVGEHNTTHVCVFSILTIIHFVAWAVLLSGVSAEVQELIQRTFSINTLMQLTDSIIIVRISFCLQRNEMYQHCVEDTATTINNNIPAFRTTTHTDGNSSNVSRSVDRSVNRGQDDMDASDDESLVSDWINGWDLLPLMFILTCHVTVTTTYHKYIKQ